MIALFDHFCQTIDALRHFRRLMDLQLHPIDLFGQPIGIDMLLVIRIVIERGEDSRVIESLDEQSLMVKIRETHGAVETVHAMLLAPRSYRIEQCMTNLQVVDKIEPTEAHMLESPFLVSPMIDDTGYTPHGFAIPIGHP